MVWNGCFINLWIKSLALLVHIPYNRDIPDKRGKYMSEENIEQMEFAQKERDAETDQKIKDGTLVEPKDLSGHYENRVKVQDLTPEEIEEIKLDHLMGDEE